MKSKILILGKGYVGQRIYESFKGRCILSSKMIRTFKDAEQEINKHNPKIIINCIGFTGHNNVDGCELDKNLTLFANSYIPIILAEAALRKNIKIVHISSGCIFHYDYSKDKPIIEDKIPDFYDLFYSRSKIYSESALKELCNEYNVLIVRIRIPLDNYPNSKNLLTKLVRYKNVIDLPNSVTYVPDFLNALKYLIRIDAKGIYNVTNKGGLRYSKLLDVYKKIYP